MYFGIIFEPGVQLTSATAAAVQVFVHAVAAVAAGARTYIPGNGCGYDLSRRAGYAMNHKGEHRCVLFFHLFPPGYPLLKRDTKICVFLNKKFGLLVPNFYYSSGTTQLTSFCGPLKKNGKSLKLR